MRKNVASQVIGAQMTTAADGTDFTGAVTVYVTGDAGTQAAGSVGSGACTHEGNGYHTYAPAQAETNYNLIAFTFKGTGAITVTVQVFTITFDPHDTVRLGLTALPNAAAAASGGLFIRGTGAGAINQNANGQVDVNVVNAAGTAWGSGAITAASIASNAIAAAKIATGAITNAKFAAGAIDAAAIANGAIDAATFAADVDAEVAAYVWNAVTSGYGGAGTYGQAVEDILADTNELQTDDLPTLIAALPTAAENRAEMDSNSTQLAAIVADTNELQTDWTNGGRLDLIADAILADTNELQTDDIPGTLSSIDGKIDTIDTVADGIKAKTDSLTFTVAGVADANITYVNEVAVGGAGTGGDPWGPA